jgi:hypothetical protein
VSIPSDDDTNSTKQSDSESESEHVSDVDMHMEDDVEALDGLDLDGNVDMDRDGDNKEEEDEEEEHQEQEEDENENDGKEPRTIGQGEMVNTSADNVDAMVDDQPIVPPEQGQEMCEHTPLPQPRASAPRPHIPGASPPTSTSGDSSPQWNGAFGPS